jgi:hypothetical protein
MSWKCVLLTETNQASLSLRRYASAAHCAVSGMGIHDASVPYLTVPLTISESGSWHFAGDEPPLSDDPRWLTHCACGYAFGPEDTYQVSPSRLYTRQDTGALLSLHDAEPGMLWDAPWFLDFNPPWAGPDGRSLVMRLPGNGEWTIDGPSSSGGGWTRTGEPPNLTARPSILSHGSGARQGYHGWLTDGILSDDLEGRTYPV